MRLVLIFLPIWGNEEKNPLLWLLLEHSGPSVADDVIAEALLAAGAKVMPNSRGQDFIEEAINVHKVCECV